MNLTAHELEQLTAILNTYARVAICPHCYVLAEKSCEVRGGSVRSGSYAGERRYPHRSRYVAAIKLVLHDPKAIDKLLKAEK